MGVNICDTRVATAKKTSSACPEQYEGTLTDGRMFYFRYRFGVASLAVGDEDCLGRRDVEMECGDRLQGQFDDVEQRDHIFRKLLDRLLTYTEVREP